MMGGQGGRASGGITYDWRGGKLPNPVSLMAWSNPLYWLGRGWALEGASSVEPYIIPVLPAHTYVAAHCVAFLCHLSLTPCPLQTQNLLGRNVRRPAAGGADSSGDASSRAADSSISGGGDDEASDRLPGPAGMRVMTVSPFDFGLARLIRPRRAGADGNRAGVHVVSFPTGDAARGEHVFAALQQG